MTVLSPARTNVALALGLPLAGVALLLLVPGGANLGALIAFSALWLTAIVALHALHGRTPALAPLMTAGEPVTRQAAPPVYPAYVVDIGRPVSRWGSSGVLLAPLELIAAAWSVPFLLLLVMVPIGLVLALVVWGLQFVLQA